MGVGKTMVEVEEKNHKKILTVKEQTKKEKKYKTQTIKWKIFTTVIFNNRSLRIMYKHLSYIFERKVFPTQSCLQGIQPTG